MTPPKVFGQCSEGHQLSDAIARVSKCDVLNHSGACTVGFLKTIRVGRIVAHPVIVSAVVQVGST